MFSLRNSWRPYAPLLLACWASPAPAPTAIVPAVVYELVDVGNPGNAADITTFGAVAYPYRMGKYEVTVADYVQFLNAVATTDTYGLWNNSMQASASCAGITRSGSSGSYVYAAMTATSGSAPFSGSGVPPFRTATGVDSSRFPIAFVSYFNAARFANWMANGQPTGPQNGTTTEDGAYFVNGARSSGQAPARNSVNPNTGLAPTFFLPTENEWYKAAYYEPALNAGRGGYYRFATRNNVAPGNAVPGSLNSTQQPDSNQANYIFGTSYVYCVTQFSAIVPGQHYLVPVGTWVQTFSPCGAFDMNGSLWELCAPSTAASVNIKIRGGAWTSLETYLDRAFYNGSVAFSTASNVGFRLAAPAL